MSGVTRVDENHAEKARQALAKWVSYESVAPTKLCDELGGLKMFMETVSPNLPSKLDFESLQRNCLKIYEEEQQIAKGTFSEFAGKISLSVDLLRCWVSLNTYVCVSAHFIDDDWKLRKWVIKYCGTFDENVSHPTIAILNSLKEWGIEKKISTLTVAEHADMVDEVKEEIQGKGKLLLNGQIFHVQCCSDVISRMVQGAYEEINEIIDKVQLLAWSRSLPLWYLTSTKLQNALQLKDMGEFSSKHTRTNYDVPSEEEWGKVRSVCRIADRIHEITKGLFEIKRPTANLFLPHLQEIKSYLTQEAASPDPFVIVVAQKMLTSFNEYWKDMYLVLAIAAFMDPRYKMKLIEFSALKHGDAQNAAYVMETIRKLYDGYAVENTQIEYLLSDSSSESEEEEDEEAEAEERSKISKKPSHNLMDKLNILREYCSMQSVTDQPLKSDLDLYLEEPISPWTERFSVLRWWEDNCMKCPQLSRMARDFLAIPMSVATSYKAFYTEPREVDKTVLPLEPEFMNALMCTRSWKLIGYN